MKPYPLAAMAMLCLVSPAIAQEGDTVDSLTVTAVRDPEEPAVVGSARLRLSRTPGAVSVVSQESFQRRTALGLDDMLRDAPGVYAQRKFGGDIRISIRGSGIGNANHNRGLILAVDGAPLNEADGYGDSQSIDPLLTRYAEVYRGGNALRFGGALLGGAVNMVTPNGLNAGFDQRARIEGGSFGLARQNLTLARRHGDWDLLAGATNQTAQGQRSQSQQNQQFGSVNLGRRLGEAGEVRLLITGANIDQQIAGALTKSQFDANPRQPAPGNYANNYSRDQRVVRTSLRASWRLSPSATVEAAVYGAWKDLDHPIFQVIDQESRNYGAFARLDWAGRVAGLRADAFVGGWAREGDLDSHFYLNQKGARGALQSVSFQNARAADVFGEGRLFVTPQLAMVGGATWGRAERDYRSRAVPGVGSTFNLRAGKTYEWLAPRIGLLWEAADGAQLFANLTKSVEPPNFGAMSPAGTGFAPVRAQQAWTAEAGMRGRRGAFIWDFTAYRAKLDGEMLQFTVSPGIPAATFNAGDTVHQGIEAALDWRFAAGWRLRQTYTWSDFRFENDAQYRNNRLPVVPEHFYRAELRYEHPGGWFLAPSVEWSASDIWVDYRNTTTAPAYAVLNLNAGLNLSPGTSLFLDIRNLADETYVSNVQAAVLAGPGSAAYWPGDGRSAYAGLSVAF